MGTIGNAQELSYNHYTVQDGLAQMQIEDLLLDSQGALWVATRGGVSRFNGYNFDSFEDLESKPGYCTEIVESSDGRIFVLGSEGIYVFDGSGFQFYGAPDKIRFNHMSYMTIDDRDQIWINRYNSKPLIFKDSVYQKFSSLFPNYELDSVGQVFFHEPSQSMLVEVIRNGIFKISKDRLIPVFNTSRRALIYNSRLKGCNSNQPLIREFSGFESRVYSFDENLNISHHFSEESGKVTEVKNPLNEDFLFTDRPRKNLLLMSTNDKVAKKLIADINAKFNTPGEVYFDDMDNIYLESDKGLIVINANQFEKLENSKANNVWTINQMTNGDMVFGGYGSGVKVFDTNGEERKTQIKDDIFCNTRSLSFELLHTYMGSARGLDSDLIIPTAEALIKYKDGNFSLFDYSKSCDTGMPSLYVFTDTKNQRILSATCKGLRILNKKGELLKLVKEDLFDHRCLLTISQDEEGKYWVGATGGIASYDFETGEIKNYTQENKGFPYNGVICAYIDYKGTLWAGSRQGLAYFDKEKDKFLVVEDFDGVEVASMITGEDSQLFLSTAGALIEANLESFYKDGKMLHRVYDKNNGLGIIGSGQNGFFKDADGKIWCTSDTGVYRFDPQNLKSKINTPLPNIVSINGHRLSYESREEAISIPEGTNNLTIEYESIGLNASNNLKYSYLLEGHDDEWSTFSKYNNCTYNNLGSGDYTFKVKNSQSEQISDTKIEVDLPLHKEPNFGGVAGLAAISLLLLSVLLGRNSRLAKKNNQLLKTQEQQLRVEKKNLQELNRLEKENKLLLEKQKEELVFQKEELEGINSRLQEDIAKIKKKQERVNAKISIVTSGQTHIMSQSDLLFINAESNGCRFHFKDGASLWNDDSLKVWDSKLDENLFIRIHRSTIAQREYITKVSYDKLTLENGIELKVGRKYKQNIS